MNKPLELKITQIDNVVVVSEFKLDEKYRGTGELIEVDHFTLTSHTYPCLLSTSLNLTGGDIKMDNLSDALVCCDKVVATETVNKIQACVDAFNEREMAKDCEPHVFELGDEYWMLDNYGAPRLYHWHTDGVDSWRANTTYLAKSKKESIRYYACLKKIYEKRKVFTRAEWDDEDIKKFYMEFNILRGKGQVEYCWRQPKAKYHFATEQDVQEVLAFIGDADLAKFFVYGNG